MNADSPNVETLCARVLGSASSDHSGLELGDAFASTCTELVKRTSRSAEDRVRVGQVFAEKGAFELIGACLDRGDETASLTAVSKLMRNLCAGVAQNQRNIASLAPKFISILSQGPAGDDDSELLHLACAQALVNLVASCDENKGPMLRAIDIKTFLGFHTSKVARTALMVIYNCMLCDSEATFVAESTASIDALLETGARLVQSHDQESSQWVFWILGLCFSARPKSLPDAWQRHAAPPLTSPSQILLLEALMECWNVPACEGDLDRIRWPLSKEKGPESPSFDALSNFAFLTVLCMRLVPQAESDMEGKSAVDATLDRVLRLLGKLTSGGLEFNENENLHVWSRELLPCILNHLRWCLEKKAPEDRKSNALRVLANMCFRCEAHQDAVRELGHLSTVLNCCNYDENSAMLREWGLLAIRNLCEGNSANQDTISQIRLHGVSAEQNTSGSVLQKAGLKAEIMQDGKIKISKKE